MNGDAACDLYQFLKAGNPDGDGKEDIIWNFTKFLVAGDGQVLARYAPQMTPEEIGSKLAEVF